MNIDKIKADAEAASHQEWDWLCESDGFDVEHSAHIANCDPATGDELFYLVLVPLILVWLLYAYFVETS